MIIALSDLAGREHRLGISEGRFVDPDAADGPVHDLRHWFALPGLADCHAHLSGDGVDDLISSAGEGLIDKMRRNARAQLAGGVLLLAEKGSKDSLTLRFLSEPEAERPDLQMAGRMIAVAGGYYPGFAAEVDEETLSEVIMEAAGGGATWVKLVGDWPRKGRGAVPNFTADALSRVVAIAHAAGCRVAIHTAAPETPEMAVGAGIDSIEHGLFLTPEDVVALGERGGAWVPTVLAMEMVAERLGAGSSGRRLLHEGLANVATLLGTAIDAGVAVLAGTDLGLPHGAVAREAARLVEYGMGAAAAVAAVSTAAYDYLGVPAGWQPGMPAGGVWYPADPREEITILQAPALVLHRGRVVVGHLP